MGNDKGSPAETPAAMASAVPAEAQSAILKGDRSRVIDLDYPVEYDGQEYKSITVRRLTGAEVSKFYADPNAKNLPMFDCPAEVIEALDADDAFEVNKVVRDFLPRSMRQAVE